MKLSFAVLLAVANKWRGMSSPLGKSRSFATSFSRKAREESAPSAGNRTEI